MESKERKRSTKWMFAGSVLFGFVALLIQVGLDWPVAGGNVIVGVASMIVIGSAAVPAFGGQYLRSLGSGTKVLAGMSLGHLAGWFVAGILNLRDLEESGFLAFALVVVVFLYGLAVVAIGTVLGSFSRLVWWAIGEEV